jgi:biotin transport system substrate-specific component
MHARPIEAVDTRRHGLTLIGVVGFAAALAAASQVSIPLPNTPVPITLQPLVVVLAGLWLGPIAGAASMILFLAAGAAGLPVFSPMGAPGLARLLGPTGGYLLAYPVAAFLAGSLAGPASGFMRRFGAATAGMLAIYLGGFAQLVVITGSLETAAVWGVIPFVALDVAKALVAAIVRPRRA